MKYYLAYGSNLNKEQMALRCPGAKVVGDILLDGYRLLFRGSKTGAYLTIEKDEASSIPVGIWEIDAAHEKALDRYEGYPSFYYKLEGYIKELPKKQKALIYVMHEDRPLGLPADYYIKVCQEGYRDFGFDESFLTKAIRDTEEGMNENRRKH